MSQDTIRVVRVPGKVYPDPRVGRRFVGMRKVRARELEAGTPPLVHTVPGGDSYVDDGPQDVPNTREIRQALADGDLALFTAPAPQVVVTEPAPAAASEPPARPARSSREERRG